MFLTAVRYFKLRLRTPCEVNREIRCIFNEFFLPESSSSLPLSIASILDRQTLHDECLRQPRLDVFNKFKELAFSYCKELYSLFLASQEFKEFQQSLYLRECCRRGVLPKRQTLLRSESADFYEGGASLSPPSCTHSLRGSTTMNNHVPEVGIIPSSRACFANLRLLRDREGEIPRSPFNKAKLSGSSHPSGEQSVGDLPGQPCSSSSELQVQLEDFDKSRVRLAESNPLWLSHFASFCKQEHQEQDFLFWQACNSFLLAPSNQQRRLAHQIYLDYIAEDSPKESHIPAQLSEAFAWSWRVCHPDPQLFRAAITAVEKQLLPLLSHLLSEKQRNRRVFNTAPHPELVTLSPEGSQRRTSLSTLTRGSMKKVTASTGHS